MNQVNRALLACIAVGLMSSLTPNILLAQPTTPPGPQPSNVNCGAAMQPCLSPPAGNQPPAPPISGATPPPGQPPATSPVVPKAAPQKLQPPPGSAPPPGHFWCATRNAFYPMSKKCLRMGGSGVSAGG